MLPLRLQMQLQDADETYGADAAAENNAYDTGGNHSNNAITNSC